MSYESHSDFDNSSSQSTLTGKKTPDINDIKQELNLFLGLLKQNPSCDPKESQNIFVGGSDAYNTFIDAENEVHWNEERQNGNLSVIYSCNESALSSVRNKEQVSFIEYEKPHPELSDIHFIICILDKAIRGKCFDLVKEARDKLTRIQYAYLQIRKENVMLNNTLNDAQREIQTLLKKLDDSQLKQNRLKELIFIANDQFQSLEKKYQATQAQLNERDEQIQQLTVRFLQSNTQLREIIVDLTSGPHNQEKINTIVQAIRMTVGRDKRLKSAGPKQEYQFESKNNFYHTIQDTKLFKENHSQRKCTDTNMQTKIVPVNQKLGSFVKNNLSHLLKAKSAKIYHSIEGTRHQPEKHQS